MTQIARVYKNVLLDHCKSRKVEYLLKDFVKTVPCSVIQLKGDENLPEQVCRIILKISSNPSMQFVVPKDAVLVRSKFIRPWFPLFLLDEVNVLSKQIQNNSSINNELWEQWKQNESLC